MSSLDPRKHYALRADANALGGYLEEPLAQPLPTLAPVSLPVVGGFATARSEAFTFNEIVSCGAAYSRVSGEPSGRDGSASILVTSVIEDLNILEVVRADRIVTQLSISITDGTDPIGFLISGTSFEGLRIAGHLCHPTLNVELQRPRDRNKAGGRLTWEEVRHTGRGQGESLLGAFKDGSEAARACVTSRHSQMTRDAPAPAAARALASVVDRLEVAGGCRSYGHLIEIADFGRLLLGELRASCDGVQLIGIRAELGCPVRGQVSVSAVGGGGTHDN